MQQGIDTYRVMIVVTEGNLEPAQQHVLSSPSGVDQI